MQVPIDMIYKIFTKKVNLTNILAFILGSSVVFNLRILLLDYNINNRSNYFLTEYLNLSDIVILLLIIANIFKEKKVKLLHPIISFIFIILFAQIWNDTYPLLGFYQILRLLALVYFGQYTFNTPQLKYLLRGFFVALFGHIFILITQFLLQRNLGVPFITESQFNTNMVGIAKLNLGDNFLIRGYGTFPHPNILAFVGFMGLLFLLHTKYKKFVSWAILINIIIISQIDHYLWTFNQSLLLTFISILVSISNIDLESNYKRNYILYSICIVMIFLSFSKSIYILSGLLFLTLVIKNLLTRHSKNFMFHIEHLKKHFDLIFFIIFSSIFSIINYLLFYLDNSQSALQRIFYLKEMFTIIPINILNGVGTKQFILELQSQGLEFWQFQPVHNLILLILAENGILGLFILLTCLMFWMYYLLKKTYA